ncbi:hypothetical protein [Bacillus sp. FJAT-45037]|uniref:hypothetical protein n=1 Tax=Bacillus sp. FJAT-45037 TaxID=2011007 RepID=UPI000C23C663|nr:hypothetical protein [Bacillus sp. FJAT-45037]
MQKTKKALLGTALAGAIVIGAGFGTFSWFTSNAVVSGEITNSVIEITPESQVFNMKVNKGEFDNMAPSRVAFSQWTEFKNRSTEPVKLQAIFNSTLIPDPKHDPNSEASLEKYNQGAMFVFNSPVQGPGWFGNQQKNRSLSVLEGHLNGNESPYWGKEFGKFYHDLGLWVYPILEGATDEEKAQILTSAGNNLEKGNAVAFVVSEDSLSNTVELFDEEPKLNVGTGGTSNSIFVLYGAKLDETAGNEYQNAKLDVSFDISLSQVDAN